ncbi:MAG TPA: hypothetical protein VM711_05295 [Sphingomicrobium sp.]|nr:hypothetical protein [Sphingomicrobium sp.]
MNSSLLANCWLANERGIFRALSPWSFCVSRKALVDSLDEARTNGRRHDATHIALRNVGDCRWRSAPVNPYPVLAGKKTSG